MNMQASNINKKGNLLMQNASSPCSTSAIDIPLGAATLKNGQYYVPENTQVTANSKVTWTNKDTIPHTTTSDDNLINC
jgi:plastocyanin